MMTTARYSILLTAAMLMVPTVAAAQRSELTVTPLSINFPAVR